MCAKARFDILYGLGFYKEHIDRQTDTQTSSDLYNRFTPIYLSLKLANSEIEIYIDWY